MSEESGKGRIDARDTNSGREYTYLRQDKLGEGAYSKVYLAEKLPEDDHSYDGAEGNVSQVAIKVLVDGSPKTQGLLAREAKILGFLTDTKFEGTRRLVRIGADGEVLEWDSELGASQLIELEYLDGKTLESWLDEDWTGPGDPEGGALQTIRTAIRFTRHLAEALKQIEVASSQVEAEMMHRDLKPANIMVTSEGLRLFDFNVATEQADRTVQTKMVGSGRYRAPEVVKGRGQYDKRADLYSVGIILWELLHGEPADFGSTVQDDDWIVQDWPTPAYKGIDGTVLGWLTQLVEGLVCGQKERLKSPTHVLELVRELEDVLDSLSQRSAAIGREEALKSLDLIELIAELRPSGQASVVADVDESGTLQEYVREETRVQDPLEGYLEGRIRSALDEEDDAPRLLMLSGNAGDGKSYLIDRLKRHYFADVENFDERVEYIADATHAMRPDESQQERLEGFFSPFSQKCIEDGTDPPKDLYVIAMNTGMVIRFFQEAAERFQNDEVDVDFSGLRAELERQLGLRPPEAADEFPLPVEVVNLDLRSLVAQVPDPDAAGGSSELTSFFDRMIDKLDPEADDGFLAPKRAGCEECPAKPLCPVLFNLKALQMDTPREAVVNVVRRAALDPEVHLSPRNLWAFLYRIITGGQERYDVPEREENDHLCDVVRKKAKDESERDWLVEGHFTELLFEQDKNGGLWSALADLDPAFTTVPEIDRLQTRLSVKKNIDTSEEFIEETLGGDGQSLAGLQLDKLLSNLGDGYSAADRDDAAVRRTVFFNDELFSQYFDYGPYHQFERLLDTYRSHSRIQALNRMGEGERLPEQQAEVLVELGELVEEAIIRSFGRRMGQGGDMKMLRVSQPNIRSSSVLLVEAESNQLNAFFNPMELLREDLHIRAHVEDKRQELLDHLGYRPKIVSLNIADHRLIVDRHLYEFLIRVRDGQQPSAHDLAQFQALRFIAERLGNRLASQADSLHVLDGETGALHTLQRTAFGHYSMDRVEA